MIICTKCGCKNDDECRLCSKCGKKLQSSHRSIAPSAPTKTPLTRFTHKGIPTDKWLSLKRMIEAWAYLCILIAVGGICLYKEISWPLYPAIGVIGLLLWFRRI